ncbi:MAG TPA: zf-HC2 domain-containing protein [Pyrinomonadaceae bacterium]|nr:zf-HC2 domain-containing protein [Pyrinomonadaceae bacterium]
MFCSQFEERLSDYLEGTLEAEAHRLFAEHALKCPVCHETLAGVRNTMEACRVASVPAPPRDLEARILQSTVPETGMNCQDFEEFLTDYLDGFLPAPLYHRWERHAALCDRCTELPGEVVRSIGACYSYISEEKPVPAGLNERILQATLGTSKSQEIRAPWTSRAASTLRLWLDPIMSPQLATVATMLLIAVLVLTNTVSTDGSIGGVYAASIRLAEQTGGTKGLTDGLKGLVGSPSQDSQSVPVQSNNPQKPQPAKPDNNQPNNSERKR